MQYATAGLFFLGMLASCILEAQAPGVTAKRELVFERDVETLSHWYQIPRWSGRLLIWRENNRTSGPLIETVDENSVHDETQFTLPDFPAITIMDMAASQEGEIAIVGGAWTQDHPSRTFLARLSPDGRQPKITKLWPYHPEVVTYAPHGVIWTIGWKSDEDNTRTLARFIARRFDRDGKMIGETVIKPPGTGAVNLSYLTASQDRVGWFTTEGIYIEFSLDGKEIARYPGPQGASERDITGVAINDGNDVIAGRLNHQKAEFDVLDRETGSWIPASLDKAHSPKWARVLGFDGFTLVTYNTIGTLRRFNIRVGN